MSFRVFVVAELRQKASSAILRFLWCLPAVLDAEALCVCPAGATARERFAVESQELWRVLVHVAARGQEPHESPIEVESLEGREVAGRLRVEPPIEDRARRRRRKPKRSYRGPRSFLPEVFVRVEIIAPGEAWQGLEEPEEAYARGFVDVGK